MKANEVLKKLKVTRQTLCTYVRNGKIRSQKLENGRLIYQDEDVYRMMGISNNERKNVLFARVSTPKQKQHLENQIEILKEFCSKNGIIVNEIYSEIASGISFENRKEFQKMIDEIVEYKIANIFITYKDRLSRISFKLFENLFAKFGTKITVLNEIDDAKLIEKEIFNEIISLIHSFAMKLYSQRRKEKLKLIEKDLILEEKEIK